MKWSCPGSFSLVVLLAACGGEGSGSGSGSASDSEGSTGGASSGPATSPADPTADTDSGDAGESAGSAEDGESSTGETEPPPFAIDDREDFDDPQLRASIHFAPSEDLQSVVLSELAAAQDSLHLAFFNIRLEEVGDQLRDSNVAGLDVQLVLDQKQMDEEYNTLDDWMVEQGLDIVGLYNDAHEDATMHNKFALIDGRRVLTGSANYSYTALNVSDEDVLVIDDEAVAARFAEEFAELRATVDDDADHDEAPPIEVFFSPEDRLDFEVALALAGAQESIHVKMFSSSLGALTDTLIEAIDRGVNVVYIADADQAAASDTDERLTAAGAHVKLVDREFPEEVHNKLAVIDGRQILTGSFNWTAMAAFYNYENVVKVTSEALASRVEGEIVATLHRYEPGYDPADYGWPAGEQTVTVTLTNLTLTGDATVHIVADDLDVELAADGDTFTADLALPGGSALDYHYEVRDPAGNVWPETADPRPLFVAHTAPTVVYDTFRWQ